MPPASSVLVDAHTPSSRTISHVAALDGLRGIAIAGVVWYHAWLVSKVPVSFSLGSWTVNFQALAQAGFMGVDLFFFVSGFCLFYPFARHLLEGKPKPTWREFAARRIEKILPSYLLVLVVFAVLHRDWFVSAPQWWLNIAAHLAFVHPLFLQTFGSISGPFWTLGIEMEFYALFPLVCWAFLRRPMLTFAALCVVANAYRLVLAHWGANTTLYPISQLPGVIDVFGSGMISAYAIVYLRRHQFAWPSRLAATLVTLGAVAGLVLLDDRLSAIVTANGDGGQYPWVNAHRPLFTVLFMLCGIGSTVALPAWRSLVSHPVLVYLAAVSYNLYLWHLEIIVWYDAHVAPLLRGVFFSPVVTHLIVPAGLSVLVAAVATLIVEKPFLKGGWSKMVARLRCGFVRTRLFTRGVFLREAPVDCVDER